MRVRPHLGFYKFTSLNRNGGIEVNHINEEILYECLHKPLFIICVHLLKLGLGKNTDNTVMLHLSECNRSAV